MFDQVKANTKHGRGKIRHLVQISKLLKKIKDSKGFVMIKGLGLVEGWKIEVITITTLSSLLSRTSPVGGSLHTDSTTRYGGLWSGQGEC